MGSLRAMATRTCLGGALAALAAVAFVQACTESLPLAAPDASTVAPDAPDALEDGSKPEAQPKAESPCSQRTAYGFVDSVFARAGGIRVAWNDCPGSARVPLSIPFQLEVGGSGFFRATAEGFRTTLSPVFDSSGFVSIKAQVFLSVVKDIPGYDPTRAHVLVWLYGGCAGGTVTADGHPEGRVTYLDKTGAALPGAAMDNSGYAAITNLEPGPPLRPSIKTTCSFYYPFFADTVPLVADTVAVLSPQCENCPFRPE